MKVFLACIKTFRNRLSEHFCGVTFTYVSVAFFYLCLDELYVCLSAGDAIVVSLLAYDILKQCPATSWHYRLRILNILLLL
jgi:hypothetical protein